MRRNAGLTREATSPWATEEQYALFRNYLDSRHADGGMADMDVFEFAAMVEETPVRSRVWSMHPTGAASGARAVCLTDVLEDGLSMVYSFFDPTARRIAGHLHDPRPCRIAREAGLPYVYLGYWVPGSPKMGYKARFPALEIYRAGRWQRLGDPRTTPAHPSAVDRPDRRAGRPHLPARHPAHLSARSPGNSAGTMVTIPGNTQKSASASTWISTKGTTPR